MQRHIRREIETGEGSQIWRRNWFDPRRKLQQHARVIFQRNYLKPESRPIFKCWRKKTSGNKLPTKDALSDFSKELPEKWSWRIAFTICCCCKTGGVDNAELEAPGSLCLGFWRRRSLEWVTHFSMHESESEWDCCSSAHGLVLHPRIFPVGDSHCLLCHLQ